MALQMPPVVLTLDPRSENSDANDLDIDATVDNQIRGISSTGSERCMHQIASWLQKCNCYKEECAQTQLAAKSFTPRRLIDTIDFHRGQVRIVDGDFVSEPVRYITLSHCWGSGAECKLELSSIDEFKNGITLERLPRTFSEAIQVTAALGMRYIWIDSICIIQDCEDDWKSNAAQMWEVYSRSYVTLAATASSNSSEGLFRTRMASTTSPFTIEVPEGHEQISAGKYRVYNDMEWSQSVENAPLNKRGWVFQERMLSPRIIHFAQNQLYFECRELRASERFPSRIPNRFVINTFRDRLPSHGSGGMNMELMNVWDEILRNYTTLKLSRTTDKLVAISAILRQLSDAMSIGGKLFAGLWEYSFLGQLCWQASNYASTSKSSSAPSWSWVSIDGPISPNFVDLEGPSSKRNRAIATVLSVSIADEAIPFTSTSDSRLRISAPLLRMRVDQLDTKKPQPGRPEKTKKSLSAIREEAIKSLRKTNPEYTGENYRLSGMSVDGLPLGPGQSMLGMDVSVGAIVDYSGGSSEVLEPLGPPKSPLRTFRMLLEDSTAGGELCMDNDYECETLQKLCPLFLPVFCSFDTTFPEVEVLRGLVVVPAQEPGMYKRIGVGALDEYAIVPFLCDLGNQGQVDNCSTIEERMDKIKLHQSRRVKVADFVPDGWASKELDFIPQDILCYDVDII
ncbi:heterokaryon incompatibility protein-domain-containing protein [Xylariales sp. PMI_506]|nr:heterokaryon incompatibility protein-domain-containing protein [Xylariales sp. PMI_506]